MHKTESRGWVRGPKPQFLSAEILTAITSGCIYEIKEFAIKGKSVKM